MLTGKQIAINATLDALNQIRVAAINHSEITDAQKDDALNTLYRMKNYLKWLTNQKD